jgi:hypothetical protein
MKANYGGEESMMGDQRNLSGSNGRDKVARPSRAEIESLCLLEVIGDGGTTLGEVTARLGFPPALVSATEQAILALVGRGYVAVGATRVDVTEAGRTWMRRRLSELGCSTDAAA